jgi:aspartate/methionine/tyrosine aminotransferase
MSGAMLKEKRRIEKRAPELKPLRDVPYMGVIFVVAEASKLGYYGEHPDWCNLGQGMPEVGPLPGAPERVSRIDVAVPDHAYGPVQGLPELRQAVADLYNHWFRKNKKSKYSKENVAVAAGGRIALSRAVAALGPHNVGYFTPDYTAYEDMLGAFPGYTTVLIDLDAETGWSISPADLDRKIAREGLKSLVISNPCNPTGRVVQGGELGEWVRLGRDRGCLLLMDEFYSHYIWPREGGLAKGPVSSAAYIEDVDRDPVVLFDGLTKNYRYPGWRVGWAVGPRSLIETLTCAGSFLDGGGPRPIQRAAVSMIAPERAQSETMAMRAEFSKKRDLLVARLKQMGMTFPREPEGTFYGFASVADLPPPLNDGFGFFRAALREKVITVPGRFFDVNPGRKRTGPSRLDPYVRFSFGAPMPVVARGLDRLSQMIRRAR